MRWKKKFVEKTYMLQKDSSLQNGLRIEKVVKNPQNVFIHQRARISSVSMTTAFESASYW